MSNDGPAGIISKGSVGRSDGWRFLRFLSVVAPIALLAGAAGSVGLMFRVGHPPLLLRVFFVMWVLSPFVILLWANGVSKRWSLLTRAALYAVILLLALGSLAVYGAVAFGPPRAQAAFLFVVVPPTSWLFIAIIIPTAALISRSLSRQPASDV